MLTNINNMTTESKEKLVEMSLKMNEIWHLFRKGVITEYELKKCLVEIWEEYKSQFANN